MSRLWKKIKKNSDKKNYAESLADEHDLKREIKFLYRENLVLESELIFTCWYGE